jgi:hypothetical protein
MMNKNTTILNQLAEGRASLVGYSRFLRNDKVTEDRLISSSIHQCIPLAKGRHVLVLNDTTDFNFGEHQNYLSATDEHLGSMSNDGDMGFYLHPGLVVDAEHGIGLGFSYIKIWNRAHETQHKRKQDYTSLPLEAKESYRWIECGLESKKNLSGADHLTIIADRESDIYQEFALLPDLKTDLIIRSSQDRGLEESGQKLYKMLSEAPFCGSYPLRIRTSQDGRRQGRDALMEVRFKKVKIRKPTTVKDKSLPSSVELYAIEAQEKNDQVPLSEKPVCWRLLTTYTIADIKDALQIIQWYSLRWQIELLFGTMKSKGLDLEASELESGRGLKNLCLIGLQVALKINQLSQGRNSQHELSAEITFTQKQIAVLKVLVEHYEGKTEKQKNQNKAGTLAWAAWVIARMGGWKGYASEAKPGNKTMRIGLTRFENIYIGWDLAQNLCA